MILGILIIIIIIGFFVLDFKLVKKLKKNPSYDPINEMLNSNNVVSNELKKLRKYTEKNITKSYITGCSWILTNVQDKNILYTFRDNSDLLITTNGIVEKCSYELIIDSNSILITKGLITAHYDILNIHDDFIFLNKVSTEQILVFANKTKFKDMVKSKILTQASLIYDFDK